MKSPLPTPCSHRRIALLFSLSLFFAAQLLPDSTEARPLLAAYQQTLTVSGKVLSAPDNEGLPGVNVVVKGTSNGTVTDANGEYRLEVPGPATVLIFTSIGFDTQEVAVGDKTVIDMTLLASTTSLDEVVVVGYGTQEKVSVTNAVADIKGEELVQRPVSSLQQSLQGRMPGVTIIDRGGQPGSSNAQILIRGVNRPYVPVGLDQTQASQVGENSPLVIVDGIEQPYQYLNPHDVESITVLKDASSAAIYGSRAANGVLLITTKRGKPGKVSVNYSGSYSVQKSLTNPKPMDIESYLRLQNVALQNVGSAPKYSDQQIQDYTTGSVDDPLKYPLPYDWYKVMLKSAPQVNNTVSVSGGGENFKSRLSVRNQNQQGVIANTESKLTDVRLNTDFKVNDKLSFSADLNYRYQNSLEPDNITNVFRLFMQNAIWAVPQYPNGDYGGGTQGNSPLLLAENGGTNRVVNDYIFGSVKADWQIVKGLTVTSQLGIRTNNLTGKDFIKTWETRDSTVVKKTNLINSLTETRSLDREVTWNNLLNYHLEISDKHDLKVLAGYSQIYHFNTTISAYRQGFYNNDVSSLGQGANDATKSNGGGDFTWGLRSYFARLNYSYKDKYLFEANGRYDGSSRFSKTNRYAFFPSFSAGYRISQEDFWSSLRSVVSDLKIRGSWGNTGYQAIPFYAFYATMSPVTYNFNNTIAQGYEQRSLADPSLTWETTTQTDIAIDAELFNGRIALTVDYYNKRTKDILLALTVPGTYGLLPGPQNAGVIDNKGIEFLLSTRNIIGDFKLNGNVNMSINNNNVVDLAGASATIYGNDIDPRYIIGEGYPVNAFWGYQTAGLYQSDAEAAADPVFMRAAKAGDVKMVDRDGNGQINPDDMTYLGNSIPKYTFGGSINAGYKAFSLNVVLQGVSDVKIRIARALGEAGNYEGFTPDIYTDNYWTPERTDARFARPTKQDLRNQASTDRMLVDASYLRVKNVQLAYQIPTVFLQKVFLQQASVYVSATNLLTFSKLNEWHLDPEASSGWQNYYPQTRMYTLGVNIQF
ncbi:MAG TPA: TonB-dependent receptor [Cyclobacteriaceae bacterium]|nr:TonB-dependent receptor [Cyclobacteriaceae bacterium]